MGGILAAEYALKYPAQLKGLVISNMMMSVPDYNRYAKDVLAKRWTRRWWGRLRDLESPGPYESPRYMDPPRLASTPSTVPPRPLARCRHARFGQLNKQVDVLMQGPSEFGASGRLEKWDRKADLEKIAVPTLVVGAAHDTMDPKHMRGCRQS